MTIQTKEQDLILVDTTAKNTIKGGEMGAVRIENLPTRRGYGIFPTYKIPDKKKVFLLNSYFDSNDFVLEFYNSETADQEVNATMNYYLV